VHKYYTDWLCLAAEEYKSLAVSGGHT